MSTFDPDEILGMQAEGEMQTDYPTIPDGDWPAYILDVGVRSGTSAAGNDWTALDVNWVVTEPSVVAEVGMDEPRTRQTLFLDLNDSGLDLGKGKNIQLGRLREAIGQNGAGPWSPNDLIGASAIVRTEQREYNGRVYADVKGVSAS